MAATLERDSITGRCWLTFAGKPDEATRAKLKAAGWRWSGRRMAWHHPSRFAKPPEGIEFEEAGLVDYAAERADRLEGRAEKAEAQSNAVFARVHKLADSIPLGQPILVGHHSERHARRDVERIHSGMSKACALSDKAERLAAAADGSRRAQEAREDPGAICRRIAKLEKDLAAYERHEDPAELRETYASYYPGEDPDAKVAERLADRDRRAAIVRDELARARAALDAAGGLPQIVARVDDIVKIKHFVARVVKLNPKTYSCVVLGVGDDRWPLKFEKTFLKRVLGRWCTACNGTGATAAPVPGSKDWTGGPCTACGGKGFTVAPRVLAPAAADPECAEPPLPSAADPVRYAEGINEPFCACGRRISECDGSRAGCHKRAAIDAA